MAFCSTPFVGHGKMNGAAKGEQGGGNWDWNASWDHPQLPFDWNEQPWFQGGKPGLGGKAYQHGKGKGWQGFPLAPWQIPPWGKGKQDEPEAEKPEKLDPREEE